MELQSRCGCTKQSPVSRGSRVCLILRAMLIAVCACGTQFAAQPDELHEYVVARPQGVRFTARVLLSFETSEPVSLLVVGHASDSGRYRMDLCWRMATRGKDDIFNYRGGSVFVLAESGMLTCFGYITAHPITMLPSRTPPTGATRIENSIGSMDFPDLGVYLRALTVLSQRHAWRAKVEKVEGDDGQGQYLVTQTPSEPMKLVEPHVVAQQKYYMEADGRVLLSESLSPSGQVVAVTRYSEHQQLAVGAWVSLRSSTELRPGHLEARTTVTSSVNDAPPETKVVWEKLPWRRCRMERQMQVVDGRYLLPKRTTTYDQEGRVLDDIEFLTIEVCELPDSIFELSPTSEGME